MFSLADRIDGANINKHQNKGKGESSKENHYTNKNNSYMLLIFRQCANHRKHYACHNPW